MFSASILLLPEMLEVEPPTDPSTLQQHLSNPLSPQLHTTPAPIPLPSFRHTPPSTVRGRHRWPLSLDHQAFPTTSTPCLIDVLIHVDPYLEPDTQTRVRCVAKIYSLGPEYGPLWFYRPWSPNRRRRWGFGTPHKDRTVVADAPLPHSFIHFAWPYLTPTERFATTRTCSQWYLYQKLRCATMHAPIAILKHIRPSPGNPSTLPMDRAILYAAALLRFHFNYGDFVRWLGGEYTNRHRDWDNTFDKLLEARKRNPPNDFPPADYPAGKRVFTEGVPLKGHFVSPSAELPARNRYDNHPAVQENYEAVEKKFAKEEEKSFHIHLPRFLTYFIVGLMLNLLQWAWQKGKGRICVDCTNGPDGPDTPGSANTHIPKPSAENIEECPPVYYMTAFKRFIVNIWRLRITHPRKDVLLHADDVDSAFRRILYSPEMAILFAYVFGPFLIIPVGQVFGSRSAPSFFSLASDIRADAATTTDLHTKYPLYPLVNDITLPEPPAPTDLTPAIADAKNPPLSPLEQENFNNDSFVDDNGVSAYRDRIVPALQQSLLSAFTLFGWPTNDRRGSCIAPDKWDPIVSYIVLFLGYKINSRTMMVTWPYYKRKALLDEIEEALAAPQRCITPKLAASILGKIRSVYDVAPWGPYISFSLSEALKAATRSAFSNRKSWWKRGKVRLSASVRADLQFLCEFLSEPEFSPVWSRYIGLLVPRVATHQLLSDASYEGIGGWTPDFELMWRLTRDDLLLLGFPLKLVTSKDGEPEMDADGLHINPLEFIAAIVNLWLLLKCIQNLPPCATGYIVDLLSDNTSALSWMKVTAATRNPDLQPLARFASALLVQASRLLTRVQPCHIPGKDNVEADALSRLQNGRLRCWADVIARCSRLQTCRICLLPPELLLTLADLSSCRPIADTYDNVTTHLLTLDYDFLPDGSNLQVLHGSLPLDYVPPR
jgi:hypothetical protein